MNRASASSPQCPHVPLEGPSIFPGNAPFMQGSGFNASELLTATGEEQELCVVHEFDMPCPVDASVGRCLLSSVRLISSQSKQTINKLCNSSSTNVNLRVVVARYCSDCQGPRHPRWNVDKQRNSPLLQIFTVTPSVARLFQKSNMLHLMGKIATSWTNPTVFRCGSFHSGWGHVQFVAAGGEALVPMFLHRVFTESNLKFSVAVPSQQRGHTVTLQRADGRSDLGG